MLKQTAKLHFQPGGLGFGLVLLILALARQAEAFPIGTATFRDDAPFQGSTGAHTLTSADGLLTVAAWADTNATVAANLDQWWWILGVDSGTGNGALLDGNESITLQFDKAVGASYIAFLNTGGSGGSSNLARIRIAGFMSNPGAYATTNLAQRIFDLSYTNGTLTFDYLWDEGNDYGQLLFANAAASAGRTLKITGSLSPYGDATGWGAGLFRVDYQELYGGPGVEPVSVRDNYTNSFITPDGKLTIKSYADRNTTIPAKLGVYVDECFGVYGGANNGAIETNETLTLQFAPGIGLSRLDAIYSSGNITISGFSGDPGFTDLATGAYNVNYANGTLSFIPIDGTRHIYSFTNRTASAGRTLRINADVTMGSQVAIAGISYVDDHTFIAPDVPIYVNTYTNGGGLLVLNAFSDTPGTAPAYFSENVDWLGVVGGNNSQAMDGTESIQLQFARTTGLAEIGGRYINGRITISGFASDPGFVDASGLATGVSYAAGSLSYTLNAPRPAELVFTFANLGASMGKTLTLQTDGDPNSQIAVTRISYRTPPASLSIAKYGGNIVLTWPFGTLQQSTTVNGPYDVVNGATSPYTNAATGTQKYFRLKIQ